MIRQFLAASAILFLGATAVSAQPWSQPGRYDYYRPWSRDIPTNPPGEGYPTAVPESSAPGFSTEAFYPSTPVEREVRINVAVPPNAKITFNGTPTKQTGTRRHFYSPPIAAGRGYSYEVQATWTQDGRPMTLSRRVRVRAGDVVNLRFRDGSVQVDYAN